MGFIAPGSRFHGKVTAPSLRAIGVSLDDAGKVLVDINYAELGIPKFRRSEGRPSRQFDGKPTLVEAPAKSYSQPGRAVSETAPLC